MAIDIGNEAIDRITDGGINRTYVDKNNPANSSGIITTIELYVTTEMSGVKVATFYVVSGNNLTTRDYETIQIDGQDPGVVPAGFQTATVSLNVEAGDYIGIYIGAGTIDFDGTSGAGTWNHSGDKIPCEDWTFTLQTNLMMSLYGEGIPPPTYNYYGYNSS